MVYLRIALPRGIRASSATRQSPFSPATPTPYEPPAPFSFATLASFYADTRRSQELWRSALIEKCRFFSREFGCTSLNGVSAYTGHAN